MSDEPQHKPYEWADKLYEGSSGSAVASKYRDMLAMMVNALMGNSEVAQHFYAKAIIDGASDDELRGVAETAEIAKLDIGDLAANVQKAVDELRAERERPADEDNAPPSMN